MFWGIILVLVGLFLLLERTGVLDLSFGDYLIPAILIAWGGKVILSKRKR